MDPHSSLFLDIVAPVETSKGVIGGERGFDSREGYRTGRLR